MALLLPNLHWPHIRLPRSQRQRARRRAGRWDRAERAATRALVVSHANCLDGVGSAIVAARVLGGPGGEGVGIAYVQPGDMAEVLGHYAAVPGRGRRLLVADLSMQADQLEAVTKACAALRAGGWTLEWRDHHHKQWEGLDLGPLQAELTVLEVNRDATESGASLMQRALAPTDTYLARLAATIRDRDLWWNKTPDSETLEFALTQLGPRRFGDLYIQLPHPVPDSTPVVLADVAAAAKSERDGQARILQRLLRSSRSFGSGAQRVAVVYGWLPKNTGLHELIEEGHAIAINVRPNGKVSLRSRKGADVCHLVGRRFNGGGHPNASGADLGLKGPAYWWYIVRRGKVARVQEMADAALEELGRSA